MEIIRVPAAVALVLSPSRGSVLVCFFFVVVRLLVLNFHGFEAE